MYVAGNLKQYAPGACTTLKATRKLFDCHLPNVQRGGGILGLSVFYRIFGAKATHTTAFAPPRKTFMYYIGALVVA